MATYRFDHWEKDGVTIGSTNPLTTSPITADTVFNAVYVLVAPTKRTVTITSTPTGIPMTSPTGTTPFQVIVDDGASIQLQAPTQVVG